MTEAMAISAFLIVRVLIVGVFLYGLPRVLREGLLFGTAKDVLRMWDYGCGAAVLAALGVGLGISAAGWPVAGNLTGTTVLVLAAFANYIHVYSEARAVVPPEAHAPLSSASLETRDTAPAGLAKLTVGLCILRPVDHNVP